jgi:hypothetical protein
MTPGSRAESKRRDARLRAVGIKLGCGSRVRVAVGKYTSIQPCSDPACAYRGRRHR